MVPMLRALGEAAMAGPKTLLVVEDRSHTAEGPDVPAGHAGAGKGRGACPSRGRRRPSRKSRPGPTPTCLGRRVAHGQLGAMRGGGPRLPRLSPRSVRRQARDKLTFKIELGLICPPGALILYTVAGRSEGGRPFF